MTMNKVFISGFCGGEVDVRPNAQSGSDMAFFTVATNRSWKNEDTGEYEKETEWHRITVFGRLATQAKEHLSKGARVIVFGRLRTRKWTGKDGIERYQTEIVAQELDFVPKSSSSNTQPEMTRQRSSYDQATTPAFEDSDIPF